MTDIERRILDDEAPQGGEVYRHKQRGGSYAVVGRARLQTNRQLRDEEPLVIYRGDDGTLWARPIEEFCDGRFELLPNRIAPS